MKCFRRSIRSLIRYGRVKWYNISAGVVSFLARFFVS